MFNPQARWDRNLPQEDNQKELLDESIAVNCLFANGRVMPRYFIWRDRLYRVKKINFFWQERQGRVVLNYFSLGTNSGIYQISFSNDTLSWKMNKIISPD